MTRLVNFELDDVLVDFRPSARLARLESIPGRPAAELHAAWWGTDREERAEAGEHPDGEAYLRDFNARIGYPLTRAQWTDARGAAMQVRPVVFDYARGLGARPRFSIVSISRLAKPVSVSVRRMTSAS